MRQVNFALHIMWCLATSLLVAAFSGFVVLGYSLSAFYGASNTPDYTIWILGLTVIVCFLAGLVGIFYTRALWLPIFVSALTFMMTVPNLLQFASGEIITQLVGIGALTVSIGSYFAMRFREFTKTVAPHSEVLA